MSFKIVNTKNYLHGKDTGESMPFAALQPGFSFIVTDKSPAKFKSKYDTARSLASYHSRRYDKHFSTYKISHNEVLVSREA